MRDRISILLLILTLGLSPGCDHFSPPATPEGKALYRACDWLWSQQHPDGGWKSEVHGILRGGEAYTPYVLDALLQVPDTIFPRDPQKVRAGLDFIHNHLNHLGALGLGDPDILEYPNYSTAYALKLFAENPFEGSQPALRKMEQYLLAEQFDEDRGINRKNPVFGGWGFGETLLRKGETGHVDLSVTRRVLQALRAAGHSDSPTYQNGIRFLRVVQKDTAIGIAQPLHRSPGPYLHPFDGGFYYSPVILDANKAGFTLDPDSVSAHINSYVTATCDGILALLAAGEKPGSVHLSAAKNWLEAHPGWEFPEGIPPGQTGNWDRVMQFYHWHVRAQASLALSIEGNWDQVLADLLLKSQRENGSYFNPEGSPNKEDDPILATAMAIIAWTGVLEKQQSEGL